MPSTTSAIGLAALSGNLGLLMPCFDDQGAGAVRGAIVARASAFEKVVDVIPAAVLADAALHVGSVAEKVLQCYEHGRDAAILHSFGQLHRVDAKALRGAVEGVIAGGKEPGGGCLDIGIDDAES
jgi:hypothetical protein